MSEGSNDRMGYGAMHRLAGSLLASIALVLLAAPPAHSQDHGVAHLTLVSQTAFNSIKQPLLEIEVRVENAGTDSLDRLSLGITLWTAVHSRTAYELSLSNDPVPASPVHAETRPLEGALEPGQTRTFGFRLPLTFPGISLTQSLVYPLKVDLRSAGIPAGALRTPVVFLVKRPLAPLQLSWTVVLDEPILFGPDGVFRSPGLEQSLKKGGRLAGAIGALSELYSGPNPKPIDIVISPTLLAQLERMRDGYSVVEGGTTRPIPSGQGGAAAAARAIDALKQIAGSESVELSAMPLAAPRLPALVGGGLGRDLGVQLQEGRDLVTKLLGASLSPSVFRPPLSAIDQESLDALSGQGISVLLPDPTVVPQAPQPLGFAPPPTAILDATPSPVVAIVPDPSVQALLSLPATAEDPVLGAHAVLGELAAIWLEEPSVERGLAIALPENIPLSGAFFGPLVRSVASAPWLSLESATELAARFPPQEQPTRVIPLGTTTFSRSYVESLKHARRRIDTFRSMLVDPSPLPDELSTTLLLAESGEFVDIPQLGLDFIDSVRDTVASEFTKVKPASLPVTLASSRGTIPVLITNDSGQPLRVSVQLVSSHLRFTQSPSQGPLVLPVGDQTLNFTVQLQTTGRFPVDVLVKSPTGRIVSQATLIVRSTAYNRIALIITLGAALVLLGLWARRFLRRQTS